MVSILTASGFKNLESLQDFCNRFPSLSVCLDNDLEKIWVCHKNPENIPKSEEINLLPSEDYYYLSKKVKQKINAGKHFYNLLTEFSVDFIFNKIYSQFCKELTTYLFTRCYLFYNWGINAFEPVLDHFEIHTAIQKRQKRPFVRIQRKIKYNFFNNQEISEKMIAKSEDREESFDLFGEPLNSKKCRRSKVVSYKSVIEASKKAEKFYDYIKNSKNSYQEVFSLNRILYDIKQRPRWPGGHVLSKGNVDDLIVFIVEIPVVTNVPIESKLLKEHVNWVALRELLSRFIKIHETISRNDGYGRILKRHLKNVKTPKGRKLHPIPKSTVCSYVLDILRRVLPVELFGRNGVRKSFFSGLIKVINGNKGENFIWHPLLRSLLLNKTDLIWSSQLGDNYTQNQVILKLFKFILIHYVFVILRNYFYITETGTSGFGLRYYRKGDMERASSLLLNHLLQNGHIRLLSGKDLAAESTVERKWLKSGKIARRDLKRKLKKTMDADAEYKQPIAHVRFLPKSDASDELRLITNIIKRTSRSSKSNSVYKKLEKYFLGRLSRRKKNLFLVKLFLDFLVDKTGFGIKPLPSNPELEAAWHRAVHLKEKHGKLFFVKADISDAFHSVNYNILAEVLRSAFEKVSERGKVQLMKIIEWQKINGKIQKVARFSFSNRPRENSVMINRSVYLHHNKEINQCLDLKFLEIIKQVVMHQKLEIRGNAFELVKGLAQGSAGRFSTQLCEIYYSAMDTLFFGEFIGSRDSIFLRGIDDYLFVTPDEEEGRRFLELVQRGFDDYNVTFKRHKLKTNLTDGVKEVLYLGLIFNFEDMTVKPDYSKYQQSCSLSTVNLFDKWGKNHFNKKVFLQNRSLRIKCLKLHSIVVNGVYNNLKTIRRTIFEACLTQSVRVIALANYLYSGTTKNDLAVYEVLSISCYKIKKLVSSCEVSADEKCRNNFVKNGAELLFNFLKDDIIDEEYWTKLSGVFRLRKLPLKASGFLDNV